MDSGQNILEKNFNSRELLCFALPTIIMMIFMGLYTTVDTIFVSHFVNTDALAAINIVCPIINLTVGLGTMLATGGNAIIARNMGEGQPQQARENFSLLLLVGIGIGVGVFVICRLWLDQILCWLGAGGKLFPYAKAYLSIWIYFIPESILQTLFSNLFVTAGKPGLGSVLSVGAGMLNIILDYTFIVLCDMGIAGAALGTGIGCLMSSMVGTAYFLINRRGVLHFCKPRWNGKIIGESCFNGSSEMVSQLAAAITTLLFNLSMMEFIGEDGVAAITIIIYTQFFLSTLYMGFSIGVAPVIAFHHGRGDCAKLKNILKICLRFVLGSSVIVFAAAFLFGGILVSLFTGDTSAVYDLAAGGFRIFSVSFLFSGFNIFTSAAFTALSDGKTSALLSFLRTFCFLVLFLLTLPYICGIAGIWLAIPVSEFAAAGLSILSLKKQYQRFDVKS